MEVRPGYKLTEAGVIPEDWCVSTISELAAIKTGPFGTLLKAEEYSGTNGVPLISVGEIRQGFLRVTEDTPRVPEAVIRRLPQYVLRKGDIVLGRKGGVERSALIRQHEDGWFLGSDGISIRPLRGCHDEYLALQFRSHQIREWLAQNAIGTTMPSLNQGILKRLIVPLPPSKGEQVAIAKAVSDADALIESLEQLLAKKRDIKQGAMQELVVGKRRLPGFTGEWRQIGLGTLFTFKNGLNKGKGFFGFGTPIVNYMDVFRNSKIHCAELEGRVSLNAQEMKNFDVQKGDVLFTRTSETAEEVGMASVIIDEPHDTVFSGFVLRARPKTDALCNQFKAHCFRSEYVRAQIVAKASYTTRALTNGRTLSAVTLRVPSPAEQTAIASLLSDMEAEIAALETKLAKARQIKQGMMQNLLTGKIRLV